MGALIGREGLGPLRLSKEQRSSGLSKDQRSSDTLQRGKVKRRQRRWWLTKDMKFPVWRGLSKRPYPKLFLLLHQGNT